MPTVFVINKGCHNYSAAEKFGKLEFLTVGRTDPFSTGALFRELQEALKDSTPEDFILISGLPITTSIASGIFAMKHGKLNLLLRQRNGRYTPREIVLEGNL